MVIDSKTLRLLHRPTEEGKWHYVEFLERRADEILLKSRHPFLSFIVKVLEVLHLRSECVEKVYSQKMEDIRYFRK
jgi:hypothetical protein